MNNLKKVCTQSIKAVIFGGTLALTPLYALAANYMPFVMGSSNASGDVATVTASTKAALTKNGFELVGEYSPDADTQVLIVTNPALKTIASQSENGGFGAMERVAVVKKGGEVQVSYTNPAYLWNVYRMKGDIASVQAAMQAALGSQKEFGADNAMSADDLRGYHYKMMMPYFDDEDELASYDSHDQALKAVEAGLASKQGGAQKVYRIDIPGTEMSVFGVALAYKESADGFISKTIDTASSSHAAHFPYEILVVGDKAIALNGKFRIAINWPSLSMMGAGSFMSIANAPDHITAALKAVAKNQAIDSE